MGGGGKETAHIVRAKRKENEESPHLKYCHLLITDTLLQAFWNVGAKQSLEIKLKSGYVAWLPKV